MFNSHNDLIQLASMFGFVKNVNGAIQVANRIFETVLYNLFLSEEEVSDRLFRLQWQTGTSLSKRQLEYGAVIGKNL